MFQWVKNGRHRHTLAAIGYRPLEVFLDALRIAEGKRA
jgi:hypothetical protein